MIIQVRGYLTFRAVLGDQQLEVTDDQPFTLADLLARLVDDCPDLSIRAALCEEVTRRRPSIAILLNGQHFTHLPNQLNTSLHHGDEVAIFPPLVGG